MRRTSDDLSDADIRRELALCRLLASAQALHKGYAGSLCGRVTDRFLQEEEHKSPTPAWTQLFERVMVLAGGDIEDSDA